MGKALGHENESQQAFPVCAAFRATATVQAGFLAQASSAATAALNSVTG
jgi:hypothetical protein